jgi:1-acyl-sn-glycerol-3-phosphate acyltransferase
MTPFVYWFATWVTQFILLPLYTRITVTGLENVPMTGPIVIASNHLNDADPGIICTRVRRRLVFMAKVELFRVPALGQFMRAFGAFPVRRNEADLAALRHASETLKQGLGLVIFPEGRRSGDEARLNEAWPGAALVALRGDAPVLPVAITGSQRLSLPKMFLNVHRRDRVTLTIGEPFYLPKPARLNAEAAKEGTRLIMERIAALLPEDYRGYYGNTGVAPADAPDEGPGD